MHPLEKLHPPAPDHRYCMLVYTDAGVRSSNSSTQPPSSGDDVKTQAWMLRRLISIFSRAAKRPHTPRDKGFRSMMKEVGMEIKSISASLLLDSSIQFALPGLYDKSCCTT